MLNTKSWEPEMLSKSQFTDFFVFLSTKEFSADGSKSINSEHGVPRGGGWL